MFRSSRLITSSFVAILALGLCAATAAQAGNGNGNGGGGNGGSSHAGGNGGGGNQGGGNSSVASNEGTSHGQSAGKGQGNQASQLGALNAAHAAPEAFAHASPNSRVGKLKAYYQAELAAAAAQGDVQKAQKILDGLNAQLAIDQQAVLDATTPEATAAAKELVSADLAKIELATTQLNDAKTAASDLLATADTLLAAAANKTPVSDASRSWLDSVLATKQISLN